MRISYHLLILLLAVKLFAIPCRAAQFTAPPAPAEAQKWLPADTSSFGNGILQMLSQVLTSQDFQIRIALQTGVSVFLCVLLVSVMRSYGERGAPAEMIGTVCISSLLLQNSRSMIALAADTVSQISEYSKLFLPVITAAASAQGRITSSAALCVGTSVFTALLNTFIQKIMLPAIYFYLAASTAHAALGNEHFKNIKEQLKRFSVWFMKTLLAVFFTYMSITEVISGTVDKGAIKAAKAAISNVVPVIGSALSEASEMLLVSFSLTKNAIGIYGIFAFLAIILSPFLKIGVHYLTLKITAAICSFPEVKRLTELVSDYCTALGLLLSMIGTMCVLCIIAAACFLRGLE